MITPIIVDEIWIGNGPHPGPTGKYRHVIEARITDAGGNEYARATTPDEVDEFIRTHRGGPYYLEAVTLGEIAEPFGGDFDTMPDRQTGVIGMGQAW